MIAIINQAKKNKKGETLYHVQINKEYVTKFYHKRELGLAHCLMLACEAVRKERMMNVIALLNEK